MAGHHPTAYRDDWNADAYPDVVEVEDGDVEGDSMPNIIRTKSSTSRGPPPPPLFPTSVHVGRPHSFLFGSIHCIVVPFLQSVLIDRARFSPVFICESGLIATLWWSFLVLFRSNPPDLLRSTWWLWN